MTDPANPPQRPPLDELVSAVLDSYQSDDRTAHIDATFLPSHKQVVELLGILRELMFPGFFTDQRLTSADVRDHVADLMSQVRESMQRQIDHALRYVANLEAEGRGDACEQCTRRAMEVTDQFVQQIPELRRQLALDVQAAYDGDPACRHTDEVVFCYPGLFAIFIHRVAHELFKRDVPMLPRMMNEHAHSETGIDIHPGATIGDSFFIDHGTGLVVGETAIIGDRVKLYQGVTVGAPAGHLSQSARGVKRHPTIEDDVVIYANATLLGGDTIIGKGCIIGGGVFLTQSVTAGHFVYNKSQELKYRSADRIREMLAQAQAQSSD